jgi:hypothetical protein
LNLKSAANVVKHAPHSSTVAELQIGPVLVVQEVLELGEVFVTDRLASLIIEIVVKPAIQIAGLV